MWYLLTVSVLTARVARLSRDGARYLRNSTRLSLIARINRPVNTSPQRLSSRGYSRTSVSWHSSRERPRFLPAIPAFGRPAFALQYARWKYLFAIRSGRQATLSRHGNGKRYSSCFHDTLTENTRVSSTYILSRGQGGFAAVRLPCRTEGGLKPNCSDTRISLPPRRNATRTHKYRIVQQQCDLCLLYQTL